MNTNGSLDSPFIRVRVVEEGDDHYHREAYQMGFRLDGSRKQNVPFNPDLEWIYFGCRTCEQRGNMAGLFARRKDRDAVPSCKGEPNDSLPLPVM